MRRNFVIGMLLTLIIAAGALYLRYDGSLGSVLSGGDKSGETGSGSSGNAGGGSSSTADGGDSSGTQATEDTVVSGDPSTSYSSDGATVEPGGSATVSGDTLNSYTKNRVYTSFIPPLQGSGPVKAPRKGEVYLGVFQPDAPFRMYNLAKFNKKVGKKPAIVMWYQPWGKGGRNKFQTTKVRNLKRSGYVPLISWEPWDPASKASPKNNPKYSLRRINSGAFDPYIRSWARAAKASKAPVMIRPMHEMNGTWYPWGGTVNGNSAKQYVKAWRRIHRIFDQQGATNVSWVWSINEHSVPRTKANSYNAYYPGDKYVDWVGISGFNFGTGEGWSKWRHIDDIYADSYKATIKHGKPIIAVEFSSVEKGGNKAAWIRQNMRSLPTKYPRIKAVVWWNAKDRHNDFRYNSSTASAAAFKKAVRDPRYLSRATVGWK